MIAIYIGPGLTVPAFVAVPGWDVLPNWASMLSFGNNAIFYNSLNEYAESTASIKIAFDSVNWGLSTEEQEFQRLQILDNISTITFITETELYQPSLLIQSKYNLHFNNVVWIIPGAVSGNHRTISWQYHLERIATLNRKFTINLDYFKPKEKCFDALMGQWRPHRGLVNDGIINNNLENKFIKTLYRIKSKEQNLYEFGIDETVKVEEGCNSAFYSIDNVKYQGIETPLANIVPVSIYQQTAYSVITETGATNNIHMFTEKIAKACFGKRLFVVFAGAGYLKELRVQGFKTFSDIIDESYDEIDDDLTRWMTAFEQVKLLCNLPQEEILKTIQSIVEHNYIQVNRNFTQETVNKIQTIINTLYDNTSL